MNSQCGPQEFPLTSPQGKKKKKMLSVVKHVTLHRKHVQHLVLPSGNMYRNSVFSFHHNASPDHFLVCCPYIDMAEEKLHFHLHFQIIILCFLQLHSLVIFQCYNVLCCIKADPVYVWSVTKIFIIVLNSVWWTVFKLSSFSHKTGSECYRGGNTTFPLTCFIMCGISGWHQQFVA